jgi:phosphatidylglycerophosphatase A
LPDGGRAPAWRFAWSHPAHIIALGAGAGLAPAAPGTVGTLVAFPLYWLLAALSTPAVTLALIGAAFLIGIWACSATGRALGVADHGAMVWDEIVAFALVLVFTPAGWQWQAGAFLLFRFFDIVKPPPIRYFDRRLKNGFGVMFDDLLAAGYTLVILALCQRIFGAGEA